MEKVAIISIQFIIFQGNRNMRFKSDVKAVYYERNKI